MNTRRALLAAGLAMLPAAKLLGWLAHAKPDAQAVRATTRWGMLIDAAKCADCDVCVDACNAEHGLASGNAQTDAQWIRKLTLRDRRGGGVRQLPMLCQHCEDPPCVDVCPTGASFRRADGVVLVDKHTCIGCRYCVLACPYQARSFVHENLRGQQPHSPRGKGTAEGCTFCAHRIDRDIAPACVEACGRDGNGAMLFGDLNDADSEIAARMRSEPSRQARADLRLNTAVRYQNL
ncbi:MAG: 4Fe-4S dicluster domain-containing protein [Gammaproteobacteria bacterium]